MVSSIVGRKLGASLVYSRILIGRLLRAERVRRHRHRGLCYGRQHRLPPGPGGLHNTLLLERKVVCAGNTRKSGALVRMHYSNEPETRLAFASLPYFQNWSDLVGGSAGFQPVGFLALVGPENAERLRRER